MTIAYDSYIAPEIETYSDVLKRLNVPFTIDHKTGDGITHDVLTIRVNNYTEYSEISKLIQSISFCYNVGINQNNN